MLMLFINLLLVFAATALLVWGCISRKGPVKLFGFGVGLVLDVVAIIAWAYCDMWVWINFVLIAQVAGLVLWIVCDSRFKGTHNYAATLPVILAAVIAVIDFVSWIALFVWPK